MRLLQRLNIFAFLLVCISTNTLAFQSSWQTAPSSKAQSRILTHINTADENTNEIILGIEFRIPEKWHIYWKNAREVGLPPALEWESLAPSWGNDGLLFPAPKIISHPTGNGFSYGYEKNILFPLVLRKINSEKNRSKNLQFKGTLNYLICDLQCIPESREISILFPVIQEEKISKENKLIQVALNALPQKTSAVKEEWNSPTEISLLFPESFGLIENIYIARGDLADRKSLKASAEKISEREWKIILPEALSSIEWTATSKTNSWKNISEYKKPDTSSENFSLKDFWFALLFAFLGGIILNLMPCVLPVILLKATSILKLHLSKQSIRRSLIPTIFGILSSFLVLAAFTFSLQKLGHSIGWGFQFQSPIFLGFLILVLFIFALNLFDLFDINLSSKASTSLASTRGSFTEGILATLLATPCSAPFLGTALTYAISQSGLILFLLFFVMGLGLSTPYFLLLLYPQALRIFPKPGAWMGRLKRILAYSLLITGIWIFSVFQQITSFVIVVVLLNLLILVFILFREFRARWAILFSILAFSSAAILLPWEKTHEAINKFSKVSEIKEEIAAGKKLFVVVTADWCLTCKFNEQTVIHTKWFEALMKEKDMTLKIIDWTQRDDEVAKFLKEYGRVAIPFSAIIDSKNQIVLPELLTRSIVEKAILQL